MLNRVAFYYRMISMHFFFHAIIWLILFLYCFLQLDVGLVGIGVDTGVLRV